VFRSAGDPRPEVATVDRTPANSKDIGGGEQEEQSRPIYKRPADEGNTTKNTKESSYCLDLPDGFHLKADSSLRVAAPSSKLGSSELEESASELDTSSSEGDENSVRGNWDSPVEFLLSCLSFAVGLGNIWRFPYLCYRNGGGAFLIPYCLSLMFMGIPVFFYEMSAGQFSSEGPISVWKICPLFEGVGYGMCFLSLYIGTYYNIILSWAFFYIFSSFTDHLPWSSCENWWNTEACRRFDATNCTAHAGLINQVGDCIFQNKTTIDVWKNVTEFANNMKMPSDEFFHNFMLDVSQGIHDIGEVRWHLCLCLLLAWIIVYCALWDGIKSFGKLVYFTALFPYVVLIILLVRAATLPGYMKGIEFYLTPKWEKLGEISVWADACIQIFFSLGVTWGGMITLASYNQFKNNVYRDALIVGVGNCLTSFFAGFVIFGIIGFMAHELDVPVEEVASQGAGLAFIAYPEAVSRMPISPLWSILFFFMLLCLGFGTQFSTTETVVTIIQDKFPNLRGKNRKYLLLAVCLFMFTMGISMVTQGGLYVLQLVDNHSATYSALILGCTEVVVMSWIYGADRFLDNIKYMLGFYPFPYFFWKWAWKIVSPSIVVAILIFTWFNFSGNKYGDYHFPTWANAIGWFITFSSVIMIPIVAIIKIYNEEGSFSARVKKLCQPSYDWGPACPTHRALAGLGRGAEFDKNIGKIRGLRNDPSNITLLTNVNSSTNLLNGSTGSNNGIFGDLKDAASLAQLEPLSEAYEDEINESVYDGLNMKIINAEPSQSGPTLEVPTCTTSRSSSSSSSNSKPGKH
jgi:solute carrier family 6 amino acid transporter-like protein 5/7/9/14